MIMSISTSTVNLTDNTFTFWLATQIFNRSKPLRQVLRDRRKPRAFFENFFCKAYTDPHAKTL